MRVVAFVPVKLNSERLPLKNIRPFTNGEPLISYILKTLRHVSNIDDIYVYCSNEKVTEFLPDGIQFLKRDSYYDLSSTPFNEVLSSFAELVDADVYALTHVTAPFISAQSIQQGIDAVKSGTYDSALSVQARQGFFWKDGRPFNYQPDHIPRTQDMDVLYEETCGLYVYTRDLILQRNRRVGDYPCLVEVSKIEAVDINDELDFKIADAIFQGLNHKEK